MDSIWKTLPDDIVNIILKYNGTIKYRNGLYINQLLDIDSRYNLLINRLYLDRYKSEGYFSIVYINLPNKKMIMYYAYNYGLAVKIYDFNTEISNETELYTNITKIL